MNSMTIKKITEHHLVRTVLGPLFLMSVTPSIVILVYLINRDFSGSISQFIQACQAHGFFSLLFATWGPIFFGNKTAWFMIGVYSIFQIMLMKYLPGKRFEGPITPKGNIPVYNANGIASFVITLGAFFLGSFVLKLFSPTIIYDNFGPLLGALNVFSLLFCLALYFKGKYKPSSTDSGCGKNAIFDYYWDGFCFSFV